MKKKMILLNPLNPPVYPMLNVLKRMVGEGFLAFGEKEIIDLNEKLKDFIGIGGFQMSQVEIFPNRFSTQVDEISNLLSVFQQAGAWPDNEEADLTGFPPYTKVPNDIKAHVVQYRFNPFIGLDHQISVTFQKYMPDLSRLLITNLTDDQLRSLKLLDLLITDYAAQKDLIRRDLKYKSVLIRYLIDNSTSLIFQHEPVDSIPSTIFTFKLIDKDPDSFFRQMLSNGIEIGKHQNENGDGYFIIANFIQHSKEQIEMFVDKVNQALA